MTLNDAREGEEYVVIRVNTDGGEQILDSEGYVCAGVNNNVISNGLWKYDGTEINLYAHWEANEYTIHFEGCNADAGTMSDQTFTYDESAKLSKNIYTREGYRFVGWSETSGGSASYLDEERVLNLCHNANAEKTLYAVWAEDEEAVITYVNANPEMGSLSLAGEHLNPETGEAEGSLATANTGYHFTGWTDTVGTEISGNPEYEGWLTEEGRKLTPQKTEMTMP